jgi:hypothetical protein
MSISCHVQNGVVVFDAGVSLPEGTKVSIGPMMELPAGAKPGTGAWQAAAKAAEELREWGCDLDAWRGGR